MGGSGKRSGGRGRPRYGRDINLREAYAIRNRLRSNLRRYGRGLGWEGRISIMNDIIALLGGSP